MKNYLDKIKIKKSLKTSILVFLLSLILLSISITAYLAVDSIIIGGKNAEQITSEALQSQAEKLLTQLTVTSAEHNDMVLEKVRLDASTVATYAKNIFENPEAFARGAYWKFDDHIFMGAGGQHLNGMGDVSSVFIPNYANIDDVREEMELNAYLDYVFPKVLENNPDAVAIWTAGLQGETRYYPNIGLGNYISPDYNCTKEIFFTPATPENDPERNVTWSILYDDPAGQGLMITAIAPIYTKQKGFVGVIGIDVVLNGIIKNIEEYNPIELSHSFLMDGQGYSIALPEHVYEEILGRTREQNESRVNLNNVSSEFSRVAEKMREGSTGFMYMVMGNEEHYVAYAPLKNAGFSLCTIIEKEALLKVIDDLHQEVDDSTQSMIYGRILPVGVLIILLSLIAGFVVIDKKIKPLKKLTNVAEELSHGNFDVHADVTSNDEIGQLSASFNKMVSDLKQSRKQLIDAQSDLEKKVEQRTKELNENVKELEKGEAATLNIMEDLQKTLEDLEQSKNKIEQQNIQLKKLDKIKSDFLNITSHELRTPMSAIKGYVQMVFKQKLGQITDEQRQALNVVLRNTDRLDNLIRDILDVSRLESGTMKFVAEKTNPGKMVKEAIETMQPTAELKNIKISTEIEHDIPEMMVDPERIKQVIINIVNNAIKFSPNGTIINVRTKKEKDMILFEIQDFGRGIPKDKQEKIFEIFFQVDSGMDRKFGGAGLGLAISRGIILSHGGNIWVESEPEKGSTFRFALPIAPVQDLEGKFRDVDIFKLKESKHAIENDLRNKTVIWEEETKEKGEQS